MARPPMNQDVILHVVEYDADGNSVKDKYGKEKRRTVESKARVKKTQQLITNRNGDEIQAVLKFSLPPETVVHTGDSLEWVDHFGVTIKGPIESLGEVLNYTGEQVYYRKGFTG